MSSVIRLWVGIGIAFALAFGVSAQETELTQSIAISNNLSVQVPDSWTTELPKEGSSVVSGDSLEVLFFVDEALLAIESDRETSVSELRRLSDLVELRTEQAFPVARIDRERARGNIIYVAEYRPDAYAYLLELDDDTYLYSEAAQTEGEAITTEESALLLQIIASAEPTSTDAASRLEGIGGNGDEAPSTTSGEACTVSVAGNDPVRLRVGPGTNRTSVAFLESGDRKSVV